MANQTFKKINNPRVVVPDNQNMNVMRPFINFGVNALSLIAHTLITIVKSIPKPHSEKPVIKPGKKVIKL